MSKPGGLAFGLNTSKKGGLAKPLAGRAMFGGDDSDEDNNDSLNGGDHNAASAISSKAKKSSAPLTQPPKLKSKPGVNAMFGDLSSALTSRKNAEAAAEVDSSVYEYDNVYDSFKPKKETKQEDIERKPKYMRNLINAAEVRKRDALIAEEKKIAREREAEGDEFEGKEKFVTAAYKKQQEENRRIEEEEKRREEEEAKKNQGSGMTTFYKTLLEKDEARHAASVKAAEEMAKNGPKDATTPAEADDLDADKDAATRAKELNSHGASVDINDDGQVVDKRQLLKGGLNVGAKKKTPVAQETQRSREPDSRPNYNSGQHGRRQAMRERQSRMMEEQLEQSLKRSLEEETAQKEEMERNTKSRKTEGEISSAKERYLARKRAAEEAKKQGSGES
ncbi:hypothetical protein VHEMI05311 [[Torrubiella] hemipterigena]|uniref:Nuclear speckle splicing regulatory protein 1 N-terminal domain-containing protein n=1 Tax=[Torrubiella] hemipterigena TaxID=1531966 RepID=A0A0A1TGB5_9HYPO|nr:hypothetical protein VHEMI05311 [[Torrubiella] hemipterigena]